MDNILKDNLKSMSYYKSQQRGSRSRQVRNKQRSFFRLIIWVALLTLTFSFMVALHVNATSESDQYITENDLSVPSNDDMGAQSSPQKRVIIRSGDTLWEIAKTHAPKDMDVRVYIDQVKAHNELKSSVLYVDQIVYLPN